MKTHRKIIESLELKYEITSLDYPCDFCNSNSYRNFHISKNGRLEFNICESCLNKAKQNKKREVRR
jgi:hypothetical protein